jgi:hypothetical protein
MGAWIGDNIGNWVYMVYLVKSVDLKRCVTTDFSLCTVVLDLDQAPAPIFSPVLEQETVRYVHRHLHTVHTSVLEMEPEYTS